MESIKISMFPYTLSGVADGVRQSPDDRIKARQRISRTLKEIGNYTPEKCMYCGSPFTGNKKICNSHSIPRHCLKAMTDKGRLLNLNSLIGFDLMPSYSGMANANTFKLICTKCDGTIFRDYEDLDNFSEDMVETEGSPLHQMMLNQMAMKDYLMQYQDSLSSLWKLTELKKKKPDLDIRYITTLELDIKDYRNDINATKQLSKRGQFDSYDIGYFRVVPYQLPVAFQGVLTPRYDLQGNPINQAFDIDTRLQQIHLAVLPSDDISIVIAFRKRKDRRMRGLLKNIRALDDKSALKALIALAVNFSDKMLFSDKLNQKDISTPYMRDIAGNAGGIMSSVEYGDGIIAKEERYEVPPSLFSEADRRRQRIENYGLVPDVLTEPNG